MKKEFIKRIFSSIILIPLALFFIIKGSFFFTFFIILCLFISLYEWQALSKKKSYNISIVHRAPVEGGSILAISFVFWLILRPKMANPVGIVLDHLAS